MINAVALALVGGLVMLVAGVAGLLPVFRKNYKHSGSLRALEPTKPRRRAFT